MATDETSGAVAWTNLFVTNRRIDGGAEATMATRDRCVRGASPVPSRLSVITGQYSE
jgi:hypothetical protein